MNDRSWTRGEHVFRVVREGTLMVLMRDGRTVMADDRDGFDLLWRNIAAVARGRPINSGKPWTDDDDASLSEAFRSESNLAGLAVRFGRSRGSVKARLVRLGLLPDDGTWRAFAS